MGKPGTPGDVGTARSALSGIARRLCPRCRRGAIFAALWVMHDDCPVCGLDFDRGDPGHFTGAMYVSYGLALPLMALITLIELWIIPGWSLFRLVVLTCLLCIPLVPWLWQYSRTIWIYFDRYFDPGDDPSAESGPEPTAPAAGLDLDAGSKPRDQPSA